MKHSNFCTAILCILITIGLKPFPAVAAESPKDRIDYWQANFDELIPDEDYRAESAHEIFNRILNAAGHRPGVVPRLYIVNTESDYIPLAFAIPDGTIIISKKVLDVCYADPVRGDDRLAFILGHEIAHQLKDDFWHQRFFQAVTLSESGNPEDIEILEEVKQAAQMTDKMLAKEIQADEHGIIYAAMAGFNTDAIITEDDKVNFFEYIAQAMDPENINGFRNDPSHPSPDQRANTIRARLKQVLEKVNLYDIGLLFYEAGDYNRAILFFSEFLRFFPSREVYHNLATCHHQLALTYYQQWKQDKIGIPYQFSLAIDPRTRARQIRLRGENNFKTLFDENIQLAVKYYQTAISQDPSYQLAYNNLGCALVLNGEVYKAIGYFKDALKLNPNAPETMNNLGGAFYLIKNFEEAMGLLEQANRLDPDYAAPYFNMGKIAFSENKHKDAKAYWTTYLRMDAGSQWADIIRTTLSMPGNTSKETVFSVKKTHFRPAVGDFVDEIPTEWGRPDTTRKYYLEEEPLEVMEYRNGYSIISQNDEIIVISAKIGCTGRTFGGIAMGERTEKVAAIYGAPEKQMDLSKGESWVYNSKGIAFLFQKKQVIGWTMF